MNSMVQTQTFTSGKYKGKTFDEVYEIINTTDKNYLTRLKASKKADFLKYYNERKEQEQHLNGDILDTVIPEYVPKLLSDNQVNFIYHMADIHIRNYERLDEYLAVFERLYEHLRKEPNGLIVLCGDIVHNKNDLSPETIITTRNFLSTLASIHPVIMIAGNHDGIVNNNNRVDALTGILTGLEIPNLYYLRESGVYTYGNITFGMSGVFDKQFVQASQLPDNGNLKIALFHETIDTSKNLVGFELNGRKLVEDFDGYDYCLLGDVHYYQYLNKAKTMAYPSSLISQDVTEVDLDHGYLKWDLVGKTSSYQRVENEYQQQKFEIRDKLITVNVKEHLTSDEFRKYLETTKLPSKGNFIIKYDDDTNLSDVKIFENIIKKNTINATFRTEKSLTSNFLKEMNGTETEEDGVCFWEKFKKYCEIQGYDYEVMRTELGERMKDVVFNPKSRANWKLKVLKFENMFTYCGFNELDFTRYPPHEIVGIFAKNKFGKTSLIDIILFMLFGKCSRFSSERNPPIDLIHNDHTSFNAELEFTIGNDTYCIKRWASVPKREKIKSVKVNVSFLKNGILLDGTARTKTEDTITSIIGTYENFLATSVFVQQSNQCFFMNKSETEKKNYLYKLLQLDYFKGIEDGIKTESSKIAFQLENTLKKIEDIDRIEVANECDVLSKEVQELTTQIITHENTIEEKEKLIAVNEGKLHCVFSKEVIDKNISEAETNISYYEKELEEKQRTQSVLESQMSKSFSLIAFEDEIHEEHEHIHKEILELHEKMKPAEETTQNRAELEIELNRLKKIYDGKINDDLINLNLRPLIMEMYQKITYQVVEEIPNKKEINDLKMFISKNHDIELKVEENTKNIHKKDEAENDLKKCLEMKATLTTHEYDPKCKFCIANTFVVDAKKQIDRIPGLNKEITRYNKIINDNLDATYSKYCDGVKRLDFLEKQANAIVFNAKCDEIKREIDLMENKMTNKCEILSAWKDAEVVEKKLNYYENVVIKSKIETLKKKDRLDDLRKEKKESETLVARIEKIKQEIQSFSQKLDYAKSSLISNKEMKILSEENEIVFKEIRVLREEVQNIRATIVPNTVKKNKMEYELDKKKTVISNYDENVKEHQELTNRNKLYTDLKTVTSKNGFSLYLLEKSINIITKRVNAFIGNYIDRTIEMEVVGDHIIISSKDGESYSIFYSGAEAFCLELAFKLVFANLAQLPQSNILFIDEHVSCLDSDKIEEFDRITDFLKNNYSLSFIISHIGTLKNFIKYNIAIEKTANRSKLITY